MLRRHLASPRRRRRLARGGALLAGAGALAAVGVIWPNTGSDSGLPQHAGVKSVYVRPQSVAFDDARARAVLALEQGFVEHAVFRRDVEQAYDLVAPELLGTMTRAAWASGAIPVEPFPGEAVKEIRGRLVYSYADRVSMAIRFVPKAGTGVDEMTFDLVMRRVGASGGAGAGTWLVSSWLPSGFGVAAPRQQKATVDLLPEEAGRKGRISAGWLALPLAVLGGALLVGLGVAGRGWLRHRRALRDYHATRRP